MVQHALHQRQRTMRDNAPHKVHITNEHRVRRTMHDKQHRTLHSARRAVRRARTTGALVPRPLGHSALCGAANAATPPPPQRIPPLEVPDALAPASPVGVSMPDLVHGRASSEET